MGRVLPLFEPICAPRMPEFPRKFPLTREQIQKQLREEYAETLRRMSWPDFQKHMRLETSAEGGPRYYWILHAEIERRTLLRPAVGHAPTEGADVLLRASA